MPNKFLYTTSPPRWSPGLDRLHYLPDEFHFVDRDDISLALFARMTTKYVAQWSDQYEAHLVGGGDAHVQKGHLPETPEARAALIEALFDWLGRLDKRVPAAAVSLYLGDLPLFLQDDGVPGILTLTPTQFAELQVEWSRHGLPRDLYYPSSEQRVVIEPIEWFGGVVLVEQRYSPLRWLHRDHEAIEALRVPGEEDRTKAFGEVCDRFANALMLRCLELAEPGREPNEEEQRRLARLHLDVRLSASRARGHRLPGPAEPDEQHGELPPNPSEAILC